jgi:hypothetical protein
MKSTVRARSYAALTIGGGGSRPDSPLAGGGEGIRFLQGPPSSSGGVASAQASPLSMRAARGCAVATLLALFVALAVIVGVLARGGGGGGGGGGGESGATAVITAATPAPRPATRDTPSPAFLWPPQLEADPASADPARVPNPAKPPPPADPRLSLRLVLVVHRHGARTPLAFSYSNGTAGAAGGGASPAAVIDGPVPYSRCPKRYPGVDLDFRAISSEDVETENQQQEEKTASSPLLPPGACVDEGEPVIAAGDGSCRLGTLTRRGYAQAVRLGTWLRRRYCADGDQMEEEEQEEQEEQEDGNGRWRIRRLNCSSSSADHQLQAWRLYSSRFRRTVATLRGVLTGLVVDGQRTRALLASLEQQQDEEEDDEAAATTLAAVAANASLPRFVVDQAPRHTDEFMYGQSAACPALKALVKSAEASARAADADEAAAAAAARRACRELLPPGEEGGSRCGGEEEEQEQASSSSSASTTPLLDWRRLRDVISAMLAERGAERAVLPLPPPETTDDANKPPTTPTTPSKAMLGALADTSRYASRHEARVVAPRDGRAIALGIGPLVGRVRDAIEGAAKGGGDSSPLVIYSGHDSTIMPLLAALGEEARNLVEWPAYAASVVWEVWAAEPAGSHDDHHTKEGRRERAGAGARTPPPPPAAVVRVLYDGRVLGPAERPVAEMLAQLLPYAADDGERAAECSAGG